MRVWFNGAVLDDPTASVIRVDDHGLTVGDGVFEAIKVVDSQPGKALVEVILHEGRKHIVRRLLDAVGHPVLSLVRVQVGPISLGDTKPGKMRKLTKEEVGRLYTAAGM